jgi:hypothetical protein
MLSAAYRQIKRFLAWLNGGYSGKEAVNHPRDIKSRHGGGGDDYS